MSREFVIVNNKTDVPNSALAPLLSVAYNVAYRNRPASCIPRVINISVRYTRTCTWRGHYEDNGFSLMFAKKVAGQAVLPGKMCGTKFSSFNEMIVGLAAWMFGGCIGHGRNEKMLRAITLDAISEAAVNGDRLTRVYNEAVERETARPNREFAKLVLDNMKRQSLEFKLGRIEAQEKTWTRKLRLAQTKLSKLRRRRSALMAAEKRRAKVLAD